MIVLRHGADADRRPRRLLAVDRDGTLITDVPTYVRSAAQVQLVPEVVGCAPLLRSRGVAIAVVTNQSAVGRGLMSARTAVAVQHHTVALLRSVGFDVGLSLLCPHAPGFGCHCRKPGPEMVEFAAAHFGVARSATLMVGDAARDIEAASRAGVPAVLVRTGHGRATEVAMRCRSATPVVDTVRDAVRVWCG